MIGLDVECWRLMSPSGVVETLETCACDKLFYEK